MKNYFTATTLSQLKKEYKKLALIYHPDMATGDVEIMKIINNQYDKLFGKLKNQNNADAEAYKKDNKNKKAYATEEQVDQFKDILNAIIGLKGIIIEICGNWLWVSGETKQYKDILKRYKFHWASKKQKWYWRADKYQSRGRGKLSMDDIRNKYGSDIVKKGKREVNKLVY